jgi:hypothetical protein
MAPATPVRKISPSSLAVWLISDGGPVKLTSCIGFSPDFTLLRT